MLAVAIGVLLTASVAFAAIALLLRLRHDRRDPHTRRLREAWEPPTLDVLAGAAPDEALLERVRAGDVPHFLSFLLEYARRLHGEERSSVVRLARPYLPRLATRGTRGSAEKRGQAVQMLAELGLPEHADAVAAALDDPSPVVAMTAARGLLRRGYEEYFTVVLTRLPRFTVWSRSFLASMLARGGPGTTPFLRDTLSDSIREPLVRAVAADALRLLNDIESASIAAGILGERGEKNRELSRPACDCSGTSGTPITCPSSARSSPPGIRWWRAAAVGALGTIGGAREIPLLRDVLDDVAYWVSLEAARGLMKLGAVDTLRRLGRSEGPWAGLARQVLAE